MELDSTKPVVEINQLLEEREKIYGPAEPFYYCLAKINDEFIEFVTSHGNIKDSSGELIRIIFLKILRLSVTPSYKDNYTDIKGYLELVRRIEEKDETKDQ